MTSLVRFDKIWVWGSYRSHRKEDQEMKKCYFIKAETSKDQLQKLGFGVFSLCGLVWATRKSSDDDPQKDLYIALSNVSSFKPFRIYHDANDQMVKASEIWDLVEAGIIR